MKENKKVNLNKLKYIIILVILIIIVMFLRSLNTKNEIKRKTDFVSEKLVSISELATAKYDYSNVVSVKDNLTIKDFSIPFTEKSFVVKYTGHVIAGIDLSKSTFSIEKNILIITIPPCSILNHTIDENDLSIFDERTSIFNTLTMDDMLSEILVDKESTEKKLLDEGFLLKVTEDTTNLLKDLFSNCGFKKVTVIVSS